MWPSHIKVDTLYFPVSIKLAALDWVNIGADKKRRSSQVEAEREKSRTSLMKGASCVALFLSHKNFRRFVCVLQRKEKLLAIPTDVRPNIHSAIKASRSVSIFIFEYDDKKGAFCDKKTVLGRALRFHYSICVKSSEWEQRFSCLFMPQIFLIRTHKNPNALVAYYFLSYPKVAVWKNVPAAISRPSRSHNA